MVIPGNPEQICRELPHSKKKMGHRYKFVISASDHGEQRRDPKIRLVRIREFHSHASACRDGTRERMAPCQSDVEIANSAPLFGYLILLPPFTSKRRCLAHCGSNCGCCDKLSWKPSDSICLQIVKAFNSLDN